VRDGFWQTEYAENWMGLIRSGRLRDAVLAQGLRIGFLPHPNLQSILESQDLPDHVVPLRFTGQDVRSHFARAAALTTDYSSMAFNAAYLERPVTYFQFDAEAMFGGGHVGRGGYFDYERDGLGPVSHDLESAIDDLIEVLEHGRDPHPFYLERIRSTFQQRDGRACERVTAAIEALGRPLSAVERITAVPTPSMSRE
jgi:CDP-glycerol glycerophosphotransferase (TagB/SpsB family)